MSAVLHTPWQPLSVAQTLDAALRLFRAALLRCLPYGVLTVIAAHLPYLYNLVGGFAARPFISRPAGWWALNILGALLQTILWNATLLRLEAVAAGRRAGMGEELSAALRRAPAVLLLILVLLLASALLTLPALLLPALVRPMGFVVAGIAVAYLWVRLSCSWPAVVLHNKGVLPSLTWSIQLVRGNCLRVAAVYCVGVVMLIVLAALGAVLVGVIVPLVARDDIALITSISVDVVVALGAVFVPFCSALSFKLFEELRACQPDSGLDPRPAGAALD